MTIEPIINKRKEILNSVGTKEIKTSSNYSTLQNHTPTFDECKLSISYIRISCSHYSQIPVYKKGKMITEFCPDSSRWKDR